MKNPTAEVLKMGFRGLPLAVSQGALIKVKYSLSTLKMCESTKMGQA